MNDDTNAETRGRLEIVNGLDREFARLHFNSCAVIEQTSSDNLYAAPTPPAGSGSRQPPSIGESVLRTAAAVEQTFGGITANLWDDPFEWTLPEYLSTPAKVKAHLGEVELIRQRAFSSFTDDDCLLKQVAVPAGETRPLLDLLSDTLARAAAYQAEALLAFKILSGFSPPGFII
jgi:hypothetical protein